MRGYITTRGEFDELVEHVMDLAEHHARQHRGIIPHLAEGVWTSADRGTIYTLGRGLWLNLGGSTFFLGYHYGTRNIRVRKATRRGTVLYELTGIESKKFIDRMFKSLARAVA